MPQALTVQEVDFVLRLLPVEIWELNIIVD
jgi:hypothetical protein